MANKHRGEIDAVLDGRSYKLCLTLGALAELETAFGDADMLALAQRFESGRLRASDAVRIIAAGLRGAGLVIADEAVARLQAEGGAAGFVSIVAQLLHATFGTTDAVPAVDRRLRPQLPATPAAAAPVPEAPVEAGAPVPFPGTT
jgi:Phage tail tube protein, GTA-gp10